MSNRNFGKKMDKWICNNCGNHNKDLSIKPYIFAGNLIYLCDKCMNKWEERVNDMEHNYVKECDYL